VVKANAYGHGAALVAPVLQDAGADWFGTATVDEAVELRQAGVTKPILVLTGAGRGDVAAVLEHDLAVAVLHPEMGEEIAAVAARPVRVHLKIDSGMGRAGVVPDAIPGLVERLSNAGKLAIEGVFSHFANADSVTGEYSEHQFRVFRQGLDRLQAAGVQPRWVHLANSAATLSRSEAHFSLVRPGIALYGLPPEVSAVAAGFRPVMTLLTHIVQVKDLPPEFPISYGQTFVTRRSSKIAVLPVGYADGYGRALSNRASVLVRGQRAPVVGTVCMDMTMIDVTDVAGAERGDEVVLWGEQQGSTLSVRELAAWQGTIDYEILNRVGRRVPRVLR
jgi:alanine racemase